MKLLTSFKDGTIFQGLGDAQEAINGVGATEQGVSGWHALSVGIPNTCRGPARLSIVSHVERGGIIAATATSRNKSFRLVGELSPSPPEIHG